VLSSFNAMPLPNVHFGLLTFSSDGLCGAPTTPDIVPAANTASTINTTLNAIAPAGATPMAAAETNAVAWMKANTSVASCCRRRRRIRRT
jgi:hypothetical protein